MVKNYEIIEDNPQMVSEAMPLTLTKEKETAQHIYVKESLHRAFENMRKADSMAEREQTLDEFLEEL